MRRHRLEYPHFLDNEMAYWNALRNEYWPTTYLVDRCGRIRDRHIGEVHESQATGRSLQSRIEALLAESAAACPGR